MTADQPPKRPVDVPAVFAAADGAEATRRALRAAGRTAVWVGRADEAELAEFRAELGRRA